MPKIKRYRPFYGSLQYEQPEADLSLSPILPTHTLLNQGPTIVTAVQPDKTTLFDTSYSKKELNVTEKEQKLHRALKVDTARALDINVFKVPPPCKKRKREESSEIHEGEKNTKTARIEDNGLVSKSPEVKISLLLNIDQSHGVKRKRNNDGESQNGVKRLKGHKENVTNKQTIKNKENFLDWDIVKLLGEGGFGKVFQITNQNNKKSLAMKMIPLSQSPVTMSEVAREIEILRSCDYEYVVKFINSEVQGQFHCIYMEYVDGGSLQDKIVSKVGVEPKMCKFYFRQLLLGIGYLHSMGICHGDLKPPNILLDKFGCVKIADFGFARYFKKGNSKWKLNIEGGTETNVAPEVLIWDKSYMAEPSDIWSFGIILYTMLFGEIPWPVAHHRCEGFRNWKKGIIEFHPWGKITGQTFHLVSRMLEPKPHKRFTIEDIKKSPWTTEPIDIL